MIDGSEKRKHQLVFELQSSRVFEKRSISLLDTCFTRIFVVLFQLLRYFKQLTDTTQTRT